MIKRKLLVLLLAFLIVGCRKEKPYVPPSDPHKAILGKWILIQMGNFPTMYDVPQDGDYVEYKADSILWQVSADVEIYHKKYWIDSIYHEGIFIEGIPPLIFDYRYIFYDDKLVLDNLGYFETRTAKFQRKN